ncbi:MAG: dihydroneopterin aldolase [Lacibacter sp.]|jgi:dihydroneopterin aldolase
MTCVHLKDLRFFSRHGVYAPEWEMGGPFEVSLDVWYDEANGVATLADTINYEALYKIVEQHMLQREALLEVLAAKIMQAVKDAFPQTCEICIRILKLRAPIAGIDGTVGITLKRQFS